MTDTEVFGPKNLPTTIRDFRVEHSLTQASLGKLLGDVDGTHISLWETSSRAVPSEQLPGILTLLQDTALEIPQEMKSVNIKGGIHRRPNRKRPASVSKARILSHTEQAVDTSIGEQESPDIKPTSLMVLAHQFKRMASNGSLPKYVVGREFVYAVGVTLLQPVLAPPERVFARERGRQRIVELIERDPLAADIAIFTQGCEAMAEEYYKLVPEYPDLAAEGQFTRNFPALVSRPVQSHPDNEPLLTEKVAGDILQRVGL